MKDIKKRLEQLKEKIQIVWDILDISTSKTELKTLEIEMQQSDFWSYQENATRVSKHYESLKTEIEDWEKIRKEVKELLLLTKDLEAQPDEALEKDLESQLTKKENQFAKMEFVVLMNGKHDKKNAIVAIHSGSGGTEAQDWAEMLLRMIIRYSENKEWKVTLLDESKGQEAGIKSAILRVEGRYAYGYLQAEHGTHRLVRISPFDAESMRHTSFALIEVIPEIEHADIEIDEKDLRIDTFMASGKGGQSVNTTYSAVRIVHIPTGTMVSCQNERSQLQNKATAMKILQSKLQKIKEEEEEKEKLALRGEHKSAEWGNQIRSYVLHPYKLVKDVRTTYEETNPDEVLGGKLDNFIEQYLRWKKENES